MGSGVMRAVVQMNIDVGARAARKAELINQLHERRMEANVAGREIKVTDRQIETMRVRLAICDEDIQQQRQLIAHAAETSEYLKSKYTSEQLYAWMESQVRTLFYQTFLLANDLAKKAQKVHRFERRADTVEMLGRATGTAVGMAYCPVKTFIWRLNGWKPSIWKSVAMTLRSQRTSRSDNFNP